jgi:4-amino-4-deoxy-L-arabinose transferase-like glycosyltransferase
VFTGSAVAFTERVRQDRNSLLQNAAEMPKGRALGWLALISVLFLGLTLAYNLRTPYRTAGVYVPAGLKLGRDLTRAQGEEKADIGAPDERAHVNYIRHLALGHGFPVFEAGDEEGYENHQPPLYYLLCVPIDLLACGSDRAEGLLLRVFTSLIGVVSLWGVFAVARRVTGRDDAALWTTGVAALIPSYLALSSSVSNDPLLILWCTLGLLVCVQGAQDGWTWRKVWLCGAICGVSLLTKISALALVGFCVIACLVAGKRLRPGRVLAHAVVVAVLALAIASPWLVRNTILYGDPLAVTAFARGFAESPSAVDFVAAYGVSGYLVRWVGWWTLRSFFGVFGYMQLFLPGAVYVAGGLLVAASLVGGIIWQKTEKEPARRQASALCWLLFALVFLSFLRFNATYFQAQARYLLPALGPIALGLACGWPRLFPERLRPRAAWALLAALLALNAYALWLLGPGFEAISRPYLYWYSSPSIDNQTRMC